MAWKKTDSILGTQFNSRGLAKTIAAGMVCKEAERLYPGLFHAVSVRNEILTVTAPLKNKLPVKMIEGALVKDLNIYAEKHGLPRTSRVKFETEQAQ